jgi:hypothetical protein
MTVSTLLIAAKNGVEVLEEEEERTCSHGRLRHADKMINTEELRSVELEKFPETDIW